MKTTLKEIYQTFCYLGESPKNTSLQRHHQEVERKNKALQFVPDFIDKELSAIITVYDVTLF